MRWSNEQYRKIPLSSMRAHLSRDRWVRQVFITPSSREGTVPILRTTGATPRMAVRSHTVRQEGRSGVGAGEYMTCSLCQSSRIGVLVWAGEDLGRVHQSCFDEMDRRSEAFETCDAIGDGVFAQFAPLRYDLVGTNKLPMISFGRPNVRVYKSTPVPGIGLTVAQIARKVKIDPSSVRARIRRGWTVDAIMRSPRPGTRKAA